MRMRKKKHLEERLADVGALWSNQRADSVRFDADEAPKHLDFAAIFGNDNPVELEIGCGKGGFICELASRHPEINFLAVEKYANVLVSACEEAQERGLTNLHFLWGGCGVSGPLFPAPQHRKTVSQFLHPLPKKAAGHPSPDPSPLLGDVPQIPAQGRSRDPKDRRAGVFPVFAGAVFQVWVHLGEHFVGFARG